LNNHFIGLDVFFLHGHPMMRVCLTGCVIGVDYRTLYVIYYGKCSRFIHTQERYIVTSDIDVFIVDDGSGVIPCIHWHKTSTQETDIDDYNSGVRWGSVVTIEGRLSRFREELQVIISTLLLETDPNAETQHWIRTVDLRKHIYTKPEKKLFL
jgi:hypothetical protein